MLSRFACTKPWCNLDSYYQSFLCTTELTEQVSTILVELIAKRYGTFFNIFGTKLSMIQSGTNCHFVDLGGNASAQHFYATPMERRLSAGVYRCRHQLLSHTNDDLEWVQVASFHIITVCCNPNADPGIPQVNLASMGARANRGTVHGWDVNRDNGACCQLEDDYLVPSPMCSINFLTMILMEYHDPGTKGQPHHTGPVKRVNKNSKFYMLDDSAITYHVIRSSDIAV